MKTSTEHSKTVFDSPPLPSVHIDYDFLPLPFSISPACFLTFRDWVSSILVLSKLTDHSLMYPSLSNKENVSAKQLQPTHISITKNLVKAQSLSILKLEAQHIDSIEPGSFRLQSEYPITRLHKVYTVSVLYLACTLFGSPWIFRYLAWIWFGDWLKSPFLAFIYRQSQM